MILEDILNLYKSGQIHTKEVLDRIEQLKKIDELKKIKRSHKVDQLKLRHNKTALSLGQKSLFLLYKMHPDYYSYNVPICISIKKEFNIKKFEEALFIVLDKYPILRGKIMEDDNKEYMAYLNKELFHVNTKNISDYSNKEIMDYIVNKAEEPFVLEKGPLLRTEILISQTDYHIILFTIHHIIFDGSSLMIFLSSIFDTYVHLLNNEEIRRGEVNTKYNDYVDWEKAYLSSQKGKVDKKYWENQLKGNLPCIELPFKNCKTQVKRCENKIVTLHITKELSNKVKDLSKRLGISNSVVFLSVYKILLYRYTNQSNMIIGMPVMGRPSEKYDNSIGYFVNMLPIRSELRKNDTFENYVKRVQKIVFDGLDHADYPFYKQVEDLNSKERESYSDVFEIAYNYQNFFEKNAYAEFEEKYKNLLSLKINRDICQKGEHELTLDVIEEDEYIVKFKYNPYLYQDIYIENMAEHFKNLLDAAMENPYNEINSYEYLSENEKQKLIFQWNDTNCNFEK